MKKDGCQINHVTHAVSALYKLKNKKWHDGKSILHCVL